MKSNEKTSQGILTKQNLTPAKQTLSVKMIRRILGYAILSLMALIWMVPTLWLLDASFRPKIDIFQVPPVLFQGAAKAFAGYSFHSFILSFQRYNVGWSLFNSIIVTISTIILTLLICSLCAYAFAFMKFPGRKGLFIGILAVMMLPGVTMLVPYYQIIRTVGLSDNLFGLIIPASAMVLGVFLLRQYYIRIPFSFIEAAVMDGASQLRIWWKIVVPLSKPALAALAIYQFRNIWNDFLMPMIILKNDALYTLPIRLQTMDSTNISPPYDAEMATSVITVIIPLLFFMIFQRQFIQGLSGGVKG
jgi:ABC-type glycerol-3-phosphate transport system permease component